MTFARWRSLFGRSRIESEMSAELQFHMESYAEDLMKKGVSPEDALRRARMEFGSLEAKKEECRESLGLRFLDELRGDLRYALRLMKQSPGFTAIAILSLALGIGVNTAIFTLANQLLLTNMAVPQADRLRVITWEVKPNEHFPAPAWGSFGPGLASPLSYRMYLDMRRNNRVLDDLVAFKDVYRLTATVDDQADPVDGWVVSGNFYQVLGAKIIAGRAIAPEDDSPSAAPVAVISDAFWSRRFARSASALGKTINLNRVPVTIVGVNAPEFKGPKAGSTSEIFFPVSLQPLVIPDPKGSLLSRNYWWLMVMGRVKPGISDQAAHTALEADFVNAFHAAMPEKKDSQIPMFTLSPGSRGLDLQTTMFSKPIYVLVALAGLVLLIACVNLANLLLARSATRQREMSLRLAMGAGRFRVMRQSLTESMLLAILGGATGLLLGYWGRNVIPRLFDDYSHPATIGPQMDWRVFAFAFLITLATGLLFGIAPAWRSTRVDVNSGLMETGRMTHGRPKALLGKTLVALQIALSLLLLIGAGLFVRTLLNLRTTALGFNPEHILLLDINAPRSHYPGLKGIALFHQLADKIAVLPGVESASLSAAPLLANSMDRICFRPTGAAPSTEELDSPWVNRVGSSFFETMGIPIVSGRGFTPRDSEQAPKVAVINQRLAKEFFSNANPIGRTLSLCEPNEAGMPIEIVGVSGDAKYSDLHQEPPPTLYLDFLQGRGETSMTFELKTAASTPSITAEIREAVRSVDKDLPVRDVRTQSQQIDATLANERVFATLTTGFGVLALILASIGIYGVMAYTVSRRTNEIGIRMALGARSSAVLMIILREALLLTIIGVVAGLAAAAGLTRLTASMLYGLKPTDPASFGGAALVLIIIALGAGYTPARRAASVDPMDALRHE